MEIITLLYPKKLVFGNNAIYQFVDEYVANGFKKMFIVTAEPILPLISNSVDLLKKGDIEVFIDFSINNEPTYNSFNAVLEIAKSKNPDIVVGIGGGSPLDVAKLIAAQLDNNQSLDEIIGIRNLKQRNIHLVCIPTTSGTGSEVSPNAILLDESDNLKKGIVSPFLVPDASYIDPILTHSVPPSVTAATGMDALIHCMEEFTNVHAHPIIDHYALEGIKLISSNLINAYKNGDDVEAREKVALGSMYGGLGLGPVTTAAVHALSYPLGGEFHLAHGLANAVLLPYVMKYNMIAAPGKYAEVAIALGADEQSNELATAEKGVEKVFELCKELNLPVKLSKVNIPKDAIDRLVEGAMKVTRLLVNNPREITAEDARSIYLEAY